MKTKQFSIINEGDDDVNLWVVVDEENKAHFSSRDLSKAKEFIQNKNKAMTPQTPNWENSFIAELAREMAAEKNEIDF